MLEAPITAGADRSREKEGWGKVVAVVKHGTCHNPILRVRWHTESKGGLGKRGDQIGAGNPSPSSCGALNTLLIVNESVCAIDHGKNPSMMFTFFSGSTSSCLHRCSITRAGDVLLAGDGQPLKLGSAAQDQLGGGDEHGTVGHIMDGTYQIQAWAFWGPLIQDPMAIIA